jgi:hypothetical protein
VRPATLVRVCDECNYGSYEGRCVICGGPGVSDAYYCKECTLQEKDVSTGSLRDGYVMVWVGLGWVGVLGIGGQRGGMASLARWQMGCLCPGIGWGCLLQGRSDRAHQSLQITNLLICLPPPT